MRVGVIGCGSIGARHARNLLEMGHDVRVFDPNPSVVVPDGAKRRGTLRELLYGRVDVDAVLICSPASTHETMATSLRNVSYRGPLFVEKPLALSSDECAVFRSWPHPTTMVGYNLRFHPFVQLVKSMHPEGGQFSCMCDNSKYGRDVLELSHEIDLALYLGAPPTVVWALNDGLINMALGDSNWNVELWGGASSYCRKWEVATARGWFDAMFSKPEHIGAEMYRAELAHFLDCVEKQVPTITPFADGIRVVDVCEQAMKLAKATA